MYIYIYIIVGPISWLWSRQRRRSRVRGLPKALGATDAAARAVQRHDLQCTWAKLVEKAGEWRQRERDIHLTVCVCAVVFLCRIVLFRHFDGKTLIFSKRRLCMVIDPKVADCPEEKLQENCDILWLTVSEAIHQQRAFQYGRVLLTHADTGWLGLRLSNFVFVSLGSVVLNGFPIHVGLDPTFLACGFFPATWPMVVASTYLRWHDSFPISLAGKVSIL